MRGMGGWDAWLVWWIRGRATLARGIVAGAAGRARHTLSRPTAAGVAVRAGAVAAGLGALLLSYPWRLADGPTLAVLSLVAAGPAVKPRGRIPEVTMAVVVGCWLLRTWGRADQVPLWRVLALASLLYLVHASSALAAVLPVDAVVQPGILRRALLRTVMVLGSAATLSGLVVAGLMVSEGRTSAAAPYVGIAAMAAIVVLLAREPLRS